MYLFWHALFTGLFVLLICRFTKANPAWLFVLVVVFSGVLPDTDHLVYWSPIFLNMLIPRYLTEGLSFSLRTHVYASYLHLWLWPLTLVATAIIMKKWKYQKYLLASIVGWSLHLALDGVIVLI